MKGRIGVDKVFVEEALRKCGPPPPAGGAPLASTPPGDRHTGTATQGPPRAGLALRDGRGKKGRDDERRDREA